MDKEEREKIRIAIERVLEAADQQQGSEGQVGDIFEQVSDIPAVREFVVEVAIPAMQRVQTFLAECFGPVWLSASVQSYELPGGEMVYLATARSLDGKVVQEIVMERDSQLLMAARVPSGQDEWDAFAGMDEGSVATLPAQSVQGELLCLGQIFAAFKQIGKTIECYSTLPLAEKRYLLQQLQHARKHLLIGLKRR